MCISFSLEHIMDKLIPSPGNDVQQSNASDSECLPVGNDVLRISHIKYKQG